MGIHDLNFRLYICHAPGVWHERRQDAGGWPRLFAQVMESLPWKTFGRIVEHHRCDAGVCTLGCADLFRVMAVARVPAGHEAYLTAKHAKLFHMRLK